MGGVLVVGEGAKMTPAEVPLSNVPNPQMLKQGPVMNWRLMQPAFAHVCSLSVIRFQ